MAWGEINNHIIWTCDTYNGYEYITGEAQISLCPVSEGIHIFVFGCTTTAQLAFVDDIFKKRGTLQDIFITFEKCEYDKTKNELKINPGNKHRIIEAKQADRTKQIQQFQALSVPAKALPSITNLIDKTTKDKSTIHKSNVDSLISVNKF